MPDAKRASRGALARAYAANVARSFGRMALKNRRRTRGVVDSEYNGGTWERILAERSGFGTQTMEEFLAGKDNAPRLAKVDGQIVQLSTRDYYRYRIGALSELMAKHAGEARSLLVLGSGFGYNLFSLSLDPRWTKLVGFDISPNGIEAGRQIAKHFELDD